MDFSWRLLARARSAEYIDEMEVPVKVLSRTITPWWDQLRVWTEFLVDFPACGHIECLLSKLLCELTTAEPREPWAIRYRQGFHRSLRVDDRVVVGETAWALTPTGWDLVTLQADEVAVVDGLTRWRQRESQTNRWRGDWRAFTRADVAARAA